MAHSIEQGLPQKKHGRHFALAETVEQLTAYSRTTKSIEFDRELTCPMYTQELGHSMPYKQASALCTVFCMLQLASVEIIQGIYYPIILYLLSLEAAF